MIFHQNNNFVRIKMIECFSVIFFPSIEFVKRLLAPRWHLIQIKNVDTNKAKTWIHVSSHTFVYDSINCISRYTQTQRSTTIINTYIFPINHWKSPWIIWIPLKHNIFVCAKALGMSAWESHHWWNFRNKTKKRNRLAGWLAAPHKPAVEQSHGIT